MYTQSIGIAELPLRKEQSCVAQSHRAQIGDVSLTSDRTCWGVSPLRAVWTDIVNLSAKMLLNKRREGKLRD